MEFEKRLQRAIERGQRRQDARAEASAREALNEEELKRLHSQYRLQLSEHIEHCILRLPDHFPGFRYETVVGDRGWGAAVSRDDVGLGQDGGRRSFFSRLEMTVRPYSSYHVLELSAKGTIRNKEVYNRTHYQRLEEADPSAFIEMVDLWILEYAELYAAQK
ncbi:MAG TPA: hypothetical protein VHC19_10230 [Pirellulales bacterium]|jgi:hypothetical protein|nr:hypothetical protein [Pirellulales bacterium]